MQRKAGKHRERAGRDDQPAMRPSQLSCWTQPFVQHGALAWQVFVSHFAGLEKGLHGSSRLSAWVF